jgi:chitin synthase
MVYHRSLKTIFICSTMYRENETEMKQMLRSIYNVAHQHSASGNDTVTYESHIFFDGAITGTHIKEFGNQLLSLLQETLHVNIQDGKREEAPYGYRFTWNIGPSAKMPFTIHFKDPDLVKPKKRWSQVMYMNYVINYRIKKEKLNPKDTFILTTDADIDFTPHSVDLLLDILSSHVKIGAVSARTHPKGFGLVYWYQIFDYAVRHWFQKPAEHIFGCVLCSPGCFSIFRCSALEEVLEEFSSDVLCASEFLIKDMGEDRWLCTLLIKKGWRLEYCASAEDQTYCPIEFGEFYKQQRRWILSTVANLLQIMAEAMSISQRNDSISILFIVYQAVMVFSTAIAPATLILIIASGLQTAFMLSESVSSIIIIVLFFITVFYGIICMTSSPKTQIYLAKILTFIFAILMSLVVFGIVKNTVTLYSIHTGEYPGVLHSTSCGNMTNINTSNETCWTPNSTVMPVITSTFTIAALSVVFIIAALLHPKELYCLFYGVWYLLGSPSGNLVLLIYSTANLDSQSWGTREVKTKEDRGLEGWADKLIQWFGKCIKGCLRCFQKKFHVQEESKRLLASSDSN